MKQENDLMKAAVTMTACVVMGIGANSSQAVVVGQDDFDSNRDFVSFSQNPAPPSTNEFMAFDITNYDDVLTQGRALLATTDQFESTMTPDVDGNAFWVSNLTDPPGVPGVLTWVFDTSGYNNLSFSFDMAGVTDDPPNPKPMVVLASIDGAPFAQLGSQTNTNGTLDFNGVELSKTSTTITLPIFETGDNLTVQFEISGDRVWYGFGDQLLFDNIQLTGDLVPEPGSLALLGLSGVAILVRRRNRRHA